MPEAWAIREWERQKLIEHSMIAVIHAGDQTYALQVGLHLLKLMIIIGQKGEQKGEPESLAYDPLSVAQTLERDAELFGRCPEERQAMLARILGKVLESGLSQFHAGLTKVEVLDPEKVFQGHRAMDEIEFPEEMEASG